MMTYRWVTSLSVWLGFRWGDTLYSRQISCGVGGFIWLLDPCCCCCSPRILPLPISSVGGPGIWSIRIGESDGPPDWTNSLCGCDGGGKDCSISNDNREREVLIHAQWVDDFVRWVTHFAYWIHPLVASSQAPLWSVVVVVDDEEDFDHQVHCSEE